MTDKQAAQVLEHVQAAVIAAMAARDHGDRAAAFEHVAQAMRRLASLADGLDPAEAGRMRAAVESFRGALLHGSEGEAKQRAAVMFEKSGAVQKKRDT
jgi:cytochrome c556